MQARGANEGLAAHNATTAAVVVVIPARNARATIGRTLDALRRQDFSGGWEAVVVDDCSTDGTADEAMRFGFRVVRRDLQGGPAEARNSGACASTAPMIAFTDADCEPDPGWLTALMSGLDRHDVVMGPVRPDPRTARSQFSRTLSLERPSPLFETANLGVRRAVYDRVGGFEPFISRKGSPPGLRPRPGHGHFGEDSVFGWRAVRSGATVGFEEAAVVWHAVFPRGPRGYIAERWRLRFFPALLRDAPELAKALPMGIFLSARTAHFDAAIAGVAGAIGLRRLTPLLATAPYIHRYLQLAKPWRRSILRENVVFICADAVGFAALLRGSLAARRVIL